MAEQERVVIGGVDTHKDVHVAAVVDDTGRILDTRAFAASRRGYGQLLAWLRRFGTLARVGVEGTGSYGAGLARSLTQAGVTVIEVDRPDRRMRHRRGKSDTVDAEAAARAALNGEASVTPKSRYGLVESIRVLRIAFCSARDTRTRVSNQIRDIVLTAPERLRSELEPLRSTERARRCARFRPGDVSDPTEATKAALRCLGRRYERLSAEIDELRDELDVLTERANPALRAAVGIGADVASILLVAAGDNPERLTTEAAFSALCGSSPIEASSGRTVRHRLNRGGNRQANHALWRIAMVRLTCHRETKAYAARRRAEGKTTREIVRCLKRYIAREVYGLLTHPDTVTDTGAELRARRRAAGFTQVQVAEALRTDQSRISQIENNRAPNHDLAARYRALLLERGTCMA